MKKSLLVITFIFVFCLSGCSAKDSNSYEFESTSSDMFSETTAVYPESKVADIIIENMEEWAFISDEYTQQFTYDKVEAAGFYLYSTGTKGEYYLGIVYSVNSGRTYRGYLKVYSVSEYTFEWLTSTENALYLEEYERLAFKSAASGPDKTEDVKELVAEAIEKEKEYFDRITLNKTDIIELTEEQNVLFEILYSAIKSNEYYYPDETDSSIKRPLETVKYFYLGNGVCEVLFDFFGAEYGRRIYENGSCDTLNYDESKRLDNTTSAVKFEWDPHWTDEKKEYIVKQVISENN